METSLGILIFFLLLYVAVMVAVLAFGCWIFWRMKAAVENGQQNRRRVEQHVQEQRYRQEQARVNGAWQ